MKYAIIASRLLLGLIFVVFGANFWLRLIPIPPSEGPAAAFLGAMFATGYLAFVKALEILGGLLIWSGRFTAVGLLIITPIVVNILCHDIFLVGSVNPVVGLSAVLNAVLIWSERQRFLPIFR